MYSIDKSLNSKFLYSANTMNLSCERRSIEYFLVLGVRKGNIKTVARQKCSDGMEQTFGYFPIFVSTQNKGKP